MHQCMHWIVPSDATAIYYHYASQEQMPIHAFYRKCSKNVVIVSVVFMCRSLFELG